MAPQADVMLYSMSYVNVEKFAATVKHLSPCSLTGQTTSGIKLANTEKAAASDGHWLALLEAKSPSCINGSIHGLEHRGSTSDRPESNESMKVWQLLKKLLAASWEIPKVTGVQSSSLLSRPVSFIAENPWSTVLDELLRASATPGAMLAGRNFLPPAAAVVGNSISKNTAVAVDACTYLPIMTGVGLFE